MTREEFSSRYLTNLNPQQKEAVLSVDGAVLLLAVPGSGKTTVLVHRLGYMILCCHIPPERILTMTYTRAATLEMEQRFYQLFGSQCRQRVRFSTINSLSNQIIRCYSDFKNRRWTLSLPANKEDFRFIQQIYQEVNKEFPTDNTVNDVLRAIAYVKNQMLPVSEIETVDLGIDNLTVIYKQYEKRMRSEGLMDFDDQMVFAHKILTDFPEILSHFQEQYPYLCVDESQDTSKIQHAIIRLLTGQNLFMVGDEDQSIYGFRAAYPEALLNFEKEYANARILLMETNYRSTEQIVTAANRFISRNKARHPKESKATQGSGLPIRTVKMPNRSTQLKYVLAEAANCSRDTAILFRNNDSALPLIDSFERKHIPFRFRGSDDKFFTHKVVQDIVDMLRFSYDLQNAELFMRIYYKFGAITKEAALHACQQSAQTGRTIPVELAKAPGLSKYGQEVARDLALLLPTLPKSSADAALNCLWNTLKYGNFVADRGLDAGKLEILRLLAVHEPTPLALLERLDTLRELMQNPPSTPDCCLTLSTVHSSKGLEYDRVILLDLFDGILPSKARAEAEAAGETSQYEEDRRLCYVAMTRARQELTLFLLDDRPSEFAAEIAAGLPRISQDSQDVFAPLQKGLRGKTYHHKTQGRGTVIAQSEDSLLVEFSSGAVLRMTLAEMLAERAIVYTTEKTEPVVTGSTLTPEAVVPGMRLAHKTFGPGTVLMVSNGTATIQFGKNYGQRTILLKTAIDRGFLK